MKKIILGFVATTAVAAPIALIAGSANADTAPGSTCTPSDATTEVTHTEYEWKALVAKGGLHWEYKWTASPKNPSRDIFHLWVKSLDLTLRGLPQKTQVVVDVEAKDAVTCPVTTVDAAANSTTVTFTNSTGEPLEGGEVWTVDQGNWNLLGTTGPTGNVAAEVAPGTYDFTMVYLGARQSKTVLVDDGGAQVAFQTAHATVNFENSNGAPRADGDAWVVAPAGNWISLGTTGSTGAVSAELLAGSTYDFKMLYLGAQQSQSTLLPVGGISVDFQTTNATVNFKNSKGEPRADGDVWVVAPAGNWISLGTTGSTGAVSSELLAGSTYDFVMLYGGARESKPTLLPVGGTSVGFNTYRVEVRGQVTDAAGVKTSVKTGTWWYISPDGAWHDLGTPDAQGDAITQLLRGTYTFVHVADDDTRHTFTDVTIAASGRQVLKFVG